MSEEIDESPYCEVCGTCGYIGCCGIRNFINEHIKGKTNCKNEELIISELIGLVEYEEEKDKEIDRLNNIINELEKCLIYKMEEETKDAYDYGVRVSDAYLIYEEIYDKVKELKKAGKGE